MYLDALFDGYNYGVFREGARFRGGNHSFVIDFHVLALPRFSRAHHDVRLEKSVPTVPISGCVINC
jgi:hypothetical protein